MDIIPPKTKLLFLAVITILIKTVSCVFEPEVLLSASTNFLNHQLNIYGPEIKQLIDKQSIPDIDFNGTQNGTKIFFNLTNTTQKSQVNFNENILQIKDQHLFVINSKNINITINGHLEFKVGLTPKQRGELVIQITQLQTDTYIAFTQAKCSTEDQGLGFDVQVEKVYVHANSFKIQILHKTIDNLIISALKNLLNSRLPSIIQNQIIMTVNPLINQYSCQGITEIFEFGTQTYIAIVNTTQLPAFNTSSGVLNLNVDLTLINQITNRTNNQVSNIKIPENTQFYNKTNVSLVMSSNMINTVLWLVDDSDFLNKEVTNEALTTSALSILIPSLNKKWPNRPIIAILETSNKFSHLYFRNGKIITALSLSAQLVVNASGSGVNQTVQECIAQHKCISSVNLNITVLVSAALSIGEGNIARGLIHSLQIQEIKIIDKLADIVVDLETLEEIIGNLIPAYIPQINQVVQKGYPLPIDPSKTFNITKIYMETHQNYVNMGVELIN